MIKITLYDFYLNTILHLLALASRAAHPSSHGKRATCEHTIILVIPFSPATTRTTATTSMRLSIAPGGAFYLFPRSLEADAGAFCEKAKKYDLLLVPGDGFGTPGHFRISYCVQTETIERALPLFKKLAEDYGIR